mmetsp:Transcript_38066/g.122215  ORF Transcript_38066/g.122215 Transcript_38066/m.122215 type:complete len:230 (+) Transcript_38066:164-853(+)
MEGLDPGDDEADDAGHEHGEGGLLGSDELKGEEKEQGENRRPRRVVDKGVGVFSPHQALVLVFDGAACDPGQDQDGAAVGEPAVGGVVVEDGGEGRGDGDGDQLDAGDGQQGRHCEVRLAPRDIQDAHHRQEAMVALTVARRRHREAPPLAPLHHVEIPVANALDPPRLDSDVHGHHHRRPRNGQPQVHHAPAQHHCPNDAVRCRASRTKWRAATPSLCWCFLPSGNLS